MKSSNLICCILTVLGIFIQNHLSGQPGNHRGISYTDTIIFEEGGENDDRTSAFFDSLQSRAGSSRWAQQLHSIIIVPPSRTDEDPSTSSRTFLKYLPYQGKTIRNIEFIRLDPFGTDLDDPGPAIDNSINRFANTVHFKTLERVLERNLVIREGEKLDPYEVADNERLFRQMKFIEDVRIIIREDSIDSGFVDISIVTKDVWSKAFFAEIKEIDKGSIGLWDRNIFGTGNDFENNIHWDPSKSDFWGYDAIYRSRNILGTFINSSLNYQNVFETESYGITFERPFFIPSVKYAGGFSAVKTRTLERIWYSNNFYPKEPVSYSKLDYWLGRSFPLNGNPGQNARRRNLNVSTRLIQSHFTVRPLATSEKLFHQYHNTSLWLSSVSYTSQAFYRSNLIYSFGRTEDIPNGWLVNITGGKEFSEFTNRYYGSFRVSHGDFIYNLGYVYASVSAGSFFQSENNFEQAVTRFKLNYFTQLFVIGRYKVRYFVNFEHISGHNRFELEHLNINDKNGIRGLSAGEITGQKKMTLNLESVLFSPAIRYGFRFSFFGFYDLGLLGNESAGISDMRDYNGLGFGVRIRNERLVFPTFQFRFAFYPGLESIEPLDYFNFSGEKKLNPENFSAGPPELVRY